MGFLTVSEAMTQPVRTTTPDALLSAVARTLSEAHISGMPVCDAEGRLAGIVTEGDLIRILQRVSVPTYVDILGGVFPYPWPSALEKQLREVTAYRVDQIMTRHVVTVTPAQSLEEAARRMMERGVKRLPVVDDQSRVVGIISRADVVRALIA